MKRTLLVAVLLTVAPPIWAEDFTVETGGSDEGSGGAEAPWATLQHAANNVSAGDVVTVRSGSYAGFSLEASGTHGAPITFRAEDDTVVIDEDNSETPDGINLEGVDWVVIEGFPVEGATRAGIRAALCENVTIRGNRADQNGRWGIFTGHCDFLLIENNETSRSGDEHGIYVSNSGDHPTIRGNSIWSNNANGIHLNGDAEERRSGGAEERKSGGAEERRSGGAEERRSGRAEERKSGRAEERKSGRAEERKSTRRLPARSLISPQRRPWPAKRVATWSKIRGVVSDPSGFTDTPYLPRGRWPDRRAGRMGSLPHVDSVYRCPGSPLLQDLLEQPLRPLHRRTLLVERH